MPAIGRHVSKLSGYAPALPTPFDDDDIIDGEAFERLCDLQIANGATALVVGGTTGEAPNLTPAEHRELIRIAVGVSRGRVPVIAGAGSNATTHAVELTKDAEANGADAVLSVVPYYNKPTQEGLYAHFSEIAASTGLPVILYDVPSRTARGLSDATVARLAEMPQIIGLKDAAGDVTRPARLRALVGPAFRLLSGRRCAWFELFRTRRGWRYLGHVQCRAGSVPQHVPGMETRAGCKVAPAGACARAADRCALSRDKSGSAQIRTEPVRSHVAQGSLAAC